MSDRESLFLSRTSNEFQYLTGCRRIQCFSMMLFFYEVKNNYDDIVYLLNDNKYFAELSPDLFGADRDLNG